jgi:2,3-bisphosphoglycerate-dependent phosphoglycerate mutase
MQIYLIRHAQSINNLLWDTSGSSKGRSDDPELTETGKKQANLLADTLKKTRNLLTANHQDVQNINGYRLTHLYTSLMVRAVATGSAVARALHLPLMGWDDLHEEGGIYLEDETSGEKVGQPGKNRSYFEAYFPEMILHPSLGEKGWWNCRPHEESEQRPIRGRRVIQTLVETHGGTDHHVALFTHGGFYNHLMRAVLRLPDSKDLWFTFNNTAITRIDFGQGEVSVAYMNDVGFLPRELVS